jgi:hypothetical protein
MDRTVTVELPLDEANAMVDPCGDPELITNGCRRIHAELAKIEAQRFVHDDAATKAFDAIAELCGCKEWDYPGQVVRDVESLKRELDNTAQERDARGEILDAIRNVAYDGTLVDPKTATWTSVVNAVRELKSLNDGLTADRLKLEKQRDELKRSLTNAQNDYREMKAGRDRLARELGEMKAKRDLVVEQRDDAERRATVWHRRHDVCCPLTDGASEQKPSEVSVQPFGGEGWCIAVTAEDMPFGFWVIPMVDEHAAKLTADALRYMAGDHSAGYTRRRFGEEAV